MSNSHTNTKTSDTDYFKAVCVYDDLPVFASDKVKGVTTNYQRDAVNRILDRINSTILCVNGVCQHV